MNATNTTVASNAAADTAKPTSINLTTQTDGCWHVRAHIESILFKTDSGARDKLVAVSGPWRNGNAFDGSIL